MKKIILSLAAALLLPAALTAGEIASGSVPGSLNYQGRLERDNAPVTGPIHLYFRIFNSVSANNSGGAACGAVFQPCLWQSPEITVQATQGIFSADITPPVSVLAGGQTLYLEVQVESDTLSPREQLNSVAYSLVSKKLEDGTDVSVATITATYNVKLATAAGAVMTIGTDSAALGARLTVDGWMKVASGGIIFPDNTSMNSSGVGSASGVSSVADIDFLADSDSNLVGDIMMRTPYRQHMRISTSGLVGIGNNFTADDGPAAPKGRLDVDGSFYVGDEGVYDRDDSTVNIRGNIGVDTGIFIGKNDEQIRVGVANDIIAFAAAGLERARIHSDGYFGVGRTPGVMIHSAEDVAGDTGVRGGRVSLGDFYTWGASDNEVRAQTGYHLLLQQTNSYNVGIGTDTPREKLHVRGSVMSDYGVIAATAQFSGNVSVKGTFSADSKQGNTVELSSTTINGWLIVSGGIGSQAGLPAYIASTQTFTGQNIFVNQVKVSSDIFTLNRIGAGVVDFDFPGTKYLQVGDNQGGTYANDDGLIYLVGGSNANAKLNFYRGTTLGATLETQDGSNLALVLGGQAKTLTDSTYHRIQNSVVWVSTGYNTTPAIYVSSYMGNVGMGTSVMDPNWKLTVNGNIRLSGTGSSIIFPDGSSMATSSATSATFLSNNGNAIVQSNADLSGGGDVLLRAGSLDGLVLNTGGQVGIGTLSPVSKLNLRGGDLVLGTPYNPYGSDAVEDLVVAGNIAFDGELVQRSALPAQLSGLVVAHDVYLSTNTSYKTGVGTIAPYTSLDVNGNAQFGSGVTKSTFTSAGVLNLAVDLTVANGGTGASTFTDGGILFGNGTAAIGATGVLTNGQLLIGDGTQEPNVRALDGTANQVTVTNGVGTITLSLPQNIHTAADPTFNSLTLTTDLTVANGGTGASTFTDGGILFGNGTAAIGATGVLTNGQLLIGDGTQEPNVRALDGTANQVTVTNGVGTITLSLPQNIHTAAVPQFGGVIASYARPAADAVTGFQVRTSGGSNVLNVDTSNQRVGIGNVAPTTTLDVTGKTRTTTFQLTNGGSADYILRSDANGNATWIDPATGGLGDNLVGNEVKDATNATLTRGGSGITVDPYTLAINLGNANTWTAAQTFNGGLTCTNCITLSAVGSEVTGTLPLANGGVGATTAAGARSTIGAAASGANGDITSITGLTTDLAITHGGTGASDAATARSNLGAQAADAGLNDIAALAVTNGNFIVGNGANWVAESGATARASLALGSIATQASNSVSITGGSISGITDLAVLDGGTGASDAATARGNLGAAKSGANSDITSLSNLSTALSVGQGGTGATTDSGARTNLGLASSISQVITVKGGGAGADCTITIVNGVITATTCP